MNTKLIITLFTTLMVTLSLTACGLLNDKGWGGLTGSEKKVKYFKDARGNNVSKCRDGSLILASQGDNYLSTYGLPTEIGGNFICEGGDTPKLPKDCQGKEFRSEAELRAYWEKYQLPVGLVFFDCNAGIPTVPKDVLSSWQRHEAINPTCKDARGRKRPCV